MVALRWPLGAREKHAERPRSNARHATVKENASNFYRDGVVVCKNSVNGQFERRGWANAESRRARIKRCDGAWSTRRKETYRLFVNIVQNQCQSQHSAHSGVSQVICVFGRHLDERF